MIKHLWVAPALASVAFLLFSLHVIQPEGPWGFLAQPFRHGWGLQIALDLVNSVVLALCLAVPYARRYGVRAWPWVVLTLFTGSIGLFAFVARLRHAHETQAAAG